ncbi:patatin-like phospholipase family protein [soil metagenome]
MLGGLIVAVVIGCKSRPKTKPTDLPESLVAKRWVEPNLPEGTYVQADKAMSDGLASALGAKEPPPGRTGPIRPLNVLALSAGGKFGAYTAGVLAGWQASGTRPQEFDVVTGVSSGAIIAVYAFLGPHYDPILKQFFTETTEKQLFDKKPFRYMLKYGSIAVADPMMEIISRELNTNVMNEIRAAHQAGRRLYIATLGVQSKREVFWDIGAIACSGRPDADDLVKKIILAAVSIPGLLPPVYFDVVVDGCRYKEMHSDGGAVTQIFMKLADHQATPMPGYKWLDKSNLYILAAGKLYPDPTKAQLNLLARVSNSVSSSLYALYRAELCKLYALCMVSGMSYNIISLDPTLEVDHKSTTFNIEQMKTLYNSGYQQSCGGVPWRKMPPGGLLHEEETPRVGTCFVTVPTP